MITITITVQTGPWKSDSRTSTFQPDTSRTTNSEEAIEKILNEVKREIEIIYDK